ncbi:MAG: hypothetical protein WCR45_03005 [Bacteroidaceae bacterium]|nr:hypothetical protein [Bacteroidaceae bacterium]
MNEIADWINAEYNRRWQPEQKRIVDWDVIGLACLAVIDMIGLILVF